MNIPRHITASKRNGRLSRGPATSEGRQASARNSLRHGLLAQTIVLDDESQPFFDELLHEFTLEHQPSTPSACALVQKLTTAYWRQMRSWSIEKSIVDEEMALHDSDCPPAVRAARAFRGLADQSRVLDLIHRYETSFDRQFNRALDQLVSLPSNNHDAVHPFVPVTPAAGTWKQFFPNEPVPTNEHPENPSVEIDPTI